MIALDTSVADCCVKTAPITAWPPVILPAMQSRYPGSLVPIPVAAGTDVLPINLKPVAAGTDGNRPGRERLLVSAN